MMFESVKSKVFSKEVERDYHARRWPTEAKPYLHLERYVRCWTDPTAFKGQTILEIGAGECEYSRLIASRFDPRRVIACELFRERMLPTAHANRDSRLSFVAGDCFNLPLRNESCDVVWGSLVLCHLPNLEGAIAEIRRVLKPEGLYLGFEPNPFNLVIIYRLLFGSRSQNEYLLTPGDLKVFKEQGFDLRTTYFYARLPWRCNRFLATCLGIQAKKL